MRKNIDPGYLLPEGDVTEEELDCALVFYPARDEYRIALLGSLLYLGTWVAWERDEDKRGKDAAASWRAANECTLECWNMACLDELTDRLDALLLLIATKKDCCSESVSYSETIIVTTIITPGIGDDPSHYGETAVADWEEWFEHLCYQAHKYVDTLIHYGETIDNLVEAGGLTLESWSSILSFLQFANLPIPFFIGDAVDWLANFFAGHISTWFDGVASDLEDARANIVCTIMLGGNLRTAINTAIGSGLSWSLFYSLINYDSVLSMLYEGGAEDLYLDTETRDDCVCDGATLFEYGPDGDDWVDPDFQGWTFGGGIEERWPIVNTPGYYPNAEGVLRLGNSAETGEDLRAQFGLGSGVLTIARFTFSFLFYTGQRWTFKMGIYDDDGTLHLSPLFDSDIIGYSTLHEHTMSFDPPLELVTDTESQFHMELYRTGAADYPKSVVLFHARGWSI